MKTKKALLTKIISLFLTLNCSNASFDLQAQNPSQKISIERGQLVELAAQAEKSSIFEKQNRALILENAQLKATAKTLKEENETLSTDLGNYQKKWRYAVMVIVVFVAGLLVKLFRR